VLEAAVVRRDADRDLAALQVPGVELTAAAVGDSRLVRPGELVVAMGNPWGLVGALATGVVHTAPPNENGTRPARSRRWHARWLKADVRLAPGNSGGPLADARGQVVGINSMIVSGLAYAVPSAVVARFVAGDARARLGVSLRPVAVVVGQQPAVGLLVLEVRAGGAADRAGLLIGDVLLRADDAPFAQPGDLRLVVEDASDAGAGTVRLDLIRAGRALRRDVSLGTADRAAAA
jgi:serine protease Do